MKRPLWVMIILAILIIAVYLAITTLPYYTYNKLIKGQWSHDLYRLKMWDAKLLNPGEVRGSTVAKQEFIGLWHEFHLRDTVVSLPTGHPMFRTIPILQATDQTNDVNIGILFQGPSGRDISRLYLLKSNSWSDQYSAQGLFKLPLVKRELLKKTPLEVWQDLFTKNIVGWDLPWQEMVYNLYLLHLRSTLLPNNFAAFGKLDTKGMAYIEMPSKNKDYRTEIVFKFEEGLLLSYLLVSEIGNADSDDLRTRFLKGIDFRVSDPALAQLIYREFKQLSYNRQIDQEGMLYLLSAWSHATNDVEMLKEMIYFLERNPQNVSHLKPLYKYAFKRYKKTFTTRDLGLDSDDADIRLQREIELEALNEIVRLQQKSKSAPKVKLQTPKERMNEYLKKARENKTKDLKKKRDKMIVH
jgi:hypothetical protein